MACTGGTVIDTNSPKIFFYGQLVLAKTENYGHWLAVVDGLISPSVQAVDSYSPALWCVYWCMLYAPGVEVEPATVRELVYFAFLSCSSGSVENLSYLFSQLLGF